MKKNDTLCIYKLMFIAALLFSYFGYGQCNVNHTATNNTYPIYVGATYAQSFTATCSGNLDYFELATINTGTNSAGTLNIYSGNTITETPIYSQSYPDITIETEGDPIRFNITEAVALSMDEQYTFQVTLDNIYTKMELPGSYDGGSMWQNDNNNDATDLIFSVSIVESSPEELCNIDHSPTSTLTFALNEVLAQSFTATCDGDMAYFELTSVNAGTVSSGTLSVYNGNTTTGTPIYTQDHPELIITNPGDPITFNITGTVPLVLDNQYTFEFLVDGDVGILVEIPSTYTGGTIISNGNDTGFDSVFFVSIVENSLEVNNYHITDKKLYPNPATTFIKISNLTSVENYSIYNQLGAKVSNGVTSNNDTINVQNLTNGLYFLKFENGNTLRFIKE